MSWAKLNDIVEHIKRQYPTGCRVILLQMGDDPRPIPPNSRGTVKGVDDMGTVHCKFDCGRQLGLIYGEDVFRRLTDEELQAEERAKQ